MGQGILAVVLVTLMLGATVGLALYQGELATAFRRLVDRFLPTPPSPAGPAIQRIARDAHRLRAQLVPAPGTPMTRRVAVQRAYDDLLSDACRALGVEDTLAGLPAGTDRDAERLRVEHELGEAGLQLGLRHE